MQRDLVERAKSGDADAFTQLVRASAPRLAGVANLILRDTDRAKDAVQEAFIAAWKDMRALRDPDAWDAWLRRLTVRACYRMAKKERRRMHVEVALMPTEDSIRLPDASADVANREWVLAELGRLDIDQRSVIALQLPRPAHPGGRGHPRHPLRDRRVPTPSRPRGDARSYARAPSGRYRPGDGAIGMNDQRSFERFVADNVGGPAGGIRVPEDFYEDIHAFASRTRQRPEWLALIKEPPMRTDSGVSVGSPTARAAALMAATLALLLLPAAAAVAATLLSEDTPADNGLLVFHAETDTGMQLFTMTPEGTEMRQITHVEPEQGPEVPGAGRPDWSPDGRTIVFNENDCRIAFVDADGSDPRRVTPEPGGVCEGTPAFTPDGRSIVYSRCAAMKCEIWAMDVEGTNRRLVSDVCGAAPRVSPDGTLLATKGCPGLWVANIDGTDARQVTPDLDIAWKLDWAPDGSGIVFSDDSDDSSPEAINVATVAPEGTSLRYLTDVETGSHAYVGSYSPDGASIVYRLDRGDEYALFVVAADGSDIEQVTEFSSFRPRYIDWGAAPAG